MTCFLCGLDGDANITEEMISGKEVWSMLNRRVIVDFNRRGQPIKDSGGLFGSWLGSLSNDLNIIPINYTDWRKVPNYRKEMAWKVIQKKFWFDDPRRRRKYTLSALGGRCRDLKQRLWKKYRRNTLEESFDVRPGLIPEDQWKEFVEMQFSDKAKEEVSGIEPNRAELFIASRTKSDGSLVCNEARISVDKLSRVMSQNIQNEAPSNESRPNDVFEQVFGPEHPGRVRCAGHGTTPSKYFLNMESTTANTEIIDIKGRMKGLEDKVEILTNALYALVGPRNHFQVNAVGGNSKFNTNLHQSSSVSSDQESNISKTGI
ncbi:putative transposase Ptta/En/Spm plant [Arabidopsis thaliana x Arabidopsis arenosa]|uniref:Putative transposase Ptta/En/Spm plant n=1 Tax=Arabidopsis thaliana x Arabidopsis arenosa TaxID=1240361 RepID=A0A8T1YA12_9BRAS|nr:putative transposase Ptta/En/Spm plant [Arabidopsis thaliana x Arabidopsis arenosa]